MPKKRKANTSVDVLRRDANKTFANSATFKLISRPKGSSIFSGFLNAYKIYTMTTNTPDARPYMHANACMHAYAAIWGVKEYL